MLLKENKGKALLNDGEMRCLNNDKEVEIIATPAQEVNPKVTIEYLKGVKLDSIGEDITKTSKKIIKSDLGYTIVSSVVGGLGLALYYGSYQPFVYFIVIGVSLYGGLTLGEKLGLINFSK